MNLLDKIIIHKKKEVAQQKKLIPINELEKTFYFKSKVISLKRNLMDVHKTGIIAEFKRRSPSKGMINDSVSVKDVTMGYTLYGASGLSVLTDQNYFGGTNEDIEIARRSNDNAILRKDFIVDEYQIIEAKSLGADVILLIAASLTTTEILQFSRLAKQLGLEILFEVHDKNELEKVNSYIDIIGINNRDLKTFTVNVEQSFLLSELIPKQFLKISESGISKPETIINLKNAGFNGFLMGETFMKTKDPAKSFDDFVKRIYSLIDSGNVNKNE